MRRSSLLAAAVCGVPIATRAGAATPGFLSDLLAPLEPTGDLAGLVHDLLCQPLALRAAHMRSRRLGEQIDWESVTDRYVDVLRAVARARPAHAEARAA